MSEETASASESGTITIRKENIWKYSTFILVAILVVGAFVFFTNSDSTGTGNVVRNGDTVSIEIGDAPVIGSESAPVTIIEFSDFSCPYCAAASGDKEQAEGQAAGVQGTPAFFVNGKLIEGAQPYSVFKQAIDAELAKA